MPSVILLMRYLAPDGPPVITNSKMVDDDVYKIEDYMREDMEKERDKFVESFPEFRRAQWSIQLVDIRSHGMSSHDHIKLDPL